MAELKVLGICGSLRKASLNMVALRACAEMMPSGMALEIAPIDDVPMYNQDVFDAGLPEPVKRVRSQIAAADGLLLAAPEYNFSVSAPLKNVIDWGSRAPNQVFQDKPVAFFSVTPGPVGGARMQYDLRKILFQLWAHCLPKPEVFIGNSASKFSGGVLTDETTRKFLTEQMIAFKAWIERMKVK